MFSPNNCVYGILVLFLYNFCEATQSVELKNVTLIRTVRQIKGEGCLLPEHPSNGLWTIYKATKSFYPNQIAPFGSVLLVNCRQNYKLDGDSTVVCIDGNWSASLGQCLRTCTPRHSTAVMKVTCRYNDRVIQNCSEPLHGTLAYFQCADFYEDHSLELHPVHVCSNGRWSYSLPECVPICGRRNMQEPTLIVNGTEAKKGDYPWQVALYNASNQELLCGGTLINQRVVVTAAHCISNDEGKMYPKEMYSVAVGKYYRQYNDLRDLNDAQFSIIAEMFIPRQYRGSVQNYFGDIAILVTKEIFELSARVQPICIDWGLNRQSVLDPRRITHGFVSGWGFTIQHKDPSNILKELKIPLISDNECLKRLPENYGKFLTDDKLCAGFFEKGTSVCKGDSGGGLVTPVQQGTTANRYYLVGVVSLSPQAPTAEGGCDSQNYALYTRVHYYVQNFILEKEVIYRPIYSEDKVDSFKPVTGKTTTTTTKVYDLNSRDCISPDLIENGNWSVYASHIQQPPPGVPLPVKSRLEIRCNRGYALESPLKDDVIQCENRTWNPPVPRCLKTCEPLQSSISTEITCFNKDKKLPNCSIPVDGTIAKYKCALYYEDVELSKNPVRLCRNGSWDLEKSQCIPICGKQSTSPNLITQLGKYPWHVGIYVGDEKKFICNGALISAKTVITTASCLKDSKGETYNEKTLTIVAGNVYRDYFDARDDFLQIANVSGIWTPHYSQNIAHLAVVTAKTPFFLTYSVQPVCFDYSKNYIHDATVIINHSKAYATAYQQQDSNSTYVLQGVEMLIKASADCFSKNKTIFSDSLCASYNNQSFAKCRSDEGAPLVVKINETDRFYLAGIGSIFNEGKECNSGHAFFTKVWYYAYEVLRHELETRRFGAVFGFD